MDREKFRETWGAELQEWLIQDWKERIADPFCRLPGRADGVEDALVTGRSSGPRADGVLALTDCTGTSGATMVLAKMLVFPHMHSVDIHEGRSFPLEQIVRHASLPQATAILQYYGARGLDDEDGLGANLKPSPKATPATERPVEASVN